MLSPARGDQGAGEGVSREGVSRGGCEPGEGVSQEWPLLKAGSQTGPQTDGNMELTPPTASLSWEAGSLPISLTSPAVRGAGPGEHTGLGTHT